MPRKKIEKQLVTIDRKTLDDAIFNGVQTMLEDAGLPMSHRQKLRIADQITTGVMELVDTEGTAVKKMVVPSRKNSGGIPPKPIPAATSGIEPAPHKQ